MLRNHRLTIKNFGPIKEAEVDLHRFNVLIGLQASGKSTIAKLFHFFLSVRDELAVFLVESVLAPNPSFDFSPYLEFGGDKLGRYGWEHIVESKTLVCYDFGDGLRMWLMGREADPPPEIAGATKLQKELGAIWERLLARAAAIPVSEDAIGGVERLFRSQATRRLLEEAKRELSDLLGFDHELAMIPAHRTLLASKVVGELRVGEEIKDYIEAEFGNFVSAMDRDHRQSSAELASNTFASGADRDVAIRLRSKAAEMMKRILRADYLVESEGRRVLVLEEAGRRIPLDQASSGQQESLWILLAMFFTARTRERTFFIIEEPEANLFPDTQKELVEFIAYVCNQLGGGFFLTTHSPYILSAVNMLIYAGRVKNLGVPIEKIDPVVPRDLVLEPKDAGGYYVADGTVKPLKSDGDGSQIYEIERLDAVSEKVNETFDALLELVEPDEIREGEP